MLENRISIHEGWIKTFLFYLAIAGILWLACGWILEGAFRNVILGVMGFIGLAISGLILKDWRTGVYIFLVWLLFEDLVRKYMGNNMTIYFVKDMLVGVVYVSFLTARSREKIATFRPAFLLPLGLFIGLGIAQMFNPGSPSMLYGILGAKVYFYYIPLMFVGYGMLRDERDLRRFLILSAGVAGIIALVGIAQSVIGLSFLNPPGGQEIDYLGHLTRYTPSGVAVTRPPSVFVSDGRFSSYLVMVFVLCLGTAGYLLLRKQSGRKLVFPALALISVASMMSGSRGSVSWVAISALVLSAAMLLGAPPHTAETYRLFKAMRRGYIFIALGLGAMLVVFPEAIGARWSFYVETLDPSSQYFEVSQRAWDYPARNTMLAFTDPDWPLGHGIGTSTLGGQYVTKIVGPDVDASIHRLGLEGGFATLIFELGILGPVLWLGWTLSFMFAGWEAARRVIGTPIFPVAIAILWFGFMLLFPETFASSVAYQNFVLNAYFWFLAGILFRLPDLNQPNSLQVSTAVRSD